MLAAVQTRAQKQADLSAPRPLKIKKMEALNISCEKFKQLQKEDKGQSRYWKLATKQQSSEDAKAEFSVKEGVLYRKYKGEPHSDLVEQVCVPESLVEKVIVMAHESLLSEHQEIARTTSRILQEFYFPRLNERIRRFVRSCDLCQRCSNKKVGNQAPLQAMPVALDAFNT